MTVDVAVIGGGITGLAAAWEATTRGRTVAVVEAGPRFGGLISTDRLAVPGGHELLVDEGADAFLARVPEAVELCMELGLGDQLRPPAVGRAQVHTPDGLRWLPERSVLGVPTDLEALERTGLLSDAGLERVRRERTADHPPLEGDVSVGSLLRERFGDELVDRVVGPLVGGISAGDVDRMSVRATAPQLAAAAAGGQPMSAELADSLARSSDEPVFNCLLGGTQTLVDELVTQLRARGATLLTNHPVHSLDSLADPGSPLAGARRVVITTPAGHASRLVAGSSPDSAEALGSIETASVALTTLVYEPDAFDWPTEASGYLVPRDSGLLLTAVSWGSTKWPHWGDEGHVVVRASAGHRYDDRAAVLDEHELIDGLLADLRTTCGISEEPLAARVSRWVDGFHQYDTGHLELVERLDGSLAADTDGRVAVAGAAYRGVGIPACIRQGRAAVSG